MSFLAPLFLFGALAVAAPVIFHLIRRTTRERTIFSSLMFLLPSPPRLTRRSRLEHILLLLLRCAALCLLAFGFARPFLKKAFIDEPAPGIARRLVVLVDTSASMRRANLWADARAKAESVVRSTSPADQVALFTFARQTTPLVTFDQWDSTASSERVALVVGKLAETAPGWGSTRLGDALISAAEALADTAGKPVSGRRQVVLISDLQEGSRLEQLQGYEWPKGIELSVEPIKAKYLNNASLQLVTDLDETEPKAGVSTGVRVRVSNSPQSKREQFKVGWSQPDGEHLSNRPIEVYVPPGQSRIVAVPAPEPGLLADRILLLGDEEAFDNAVYVIPPEKLRLKVLALGSDSADDARQPLYFLQRAFQDTRRQSVQVLNSPVGVPLVGTEARTAALLLVTDSLPEARTRELRELVASGKTLLFLLKNANGASTLASLLGVERVVAEEVRPSNYAMLGEIDFRHPMFLPFADPRYSDFTKVHFWKYRKVDPASIPGAYSVAKFDNGDPAVLSVGLGKGQVLILTSGWHPEDSQLALSTKFVPLLYGLLERAADAVPQPIQYQVGDTVPVSLVSQEKIISGVRAPDGSQLAVDAGETNFTKTTMPGIYTLNSGQPVGRFAVNVDAAEGRTTPLPLDEFERLGAPVPQQARVEGAKSAQKAQLQNAELENRQKLWRWLIVATLAVLLIETWLAGRTARRLGNQPEAAT